VNYSAKLFPLNALLQQRLQYALNRDEARKIVNDKESLIKVDGKVNKNFFIKTDS